MAQIPDPLRWVFWDVDVDALDTISGRDFILPRVLEFGRLEEVRWLIRTYGLDGIHRFLRDLGHPELSERTLAFWRAVLKAEGETWVTTSDWRKISSAPWPG